MLSTGKRRWKLQSLPYVHTKFGELWSTNGENGTFFQPIQNQLFLTLISQGLRGVAPKNFANLRGWMTNACKCTPHWGWVCLQQCFYRLKFENWPKSGVL